MRYQLAALFWAMAFAPCGAASAQSKAPKVTFKCEVSYIGNLWWTVNNLRDRASDHRKFWEARFGVSDEERARLGEFAGTVNRYRRQFREWESAREAVSIEKGPVVGLFMAASSSLESVVATQAARAADLGDLRWRLLDFMPSRDIETIVRTLAHFGQNFDAVWATEQTKEAQYARRVQRILNENAAAINAFLARAAKFYGAAVEGDLTFTVYFLWSPSAQGGLSTVNEHTILCETSVNEDPRRFALSVLHELCHYLSANVPARLKVRRSERLMAQGVYFPLTLIEESLATALAQGVMGSRLAPDLFNSEKPWVSHHGGKVDKVARSLMPMAQSMLNTGETLTEQKMDTLSALCRATLPPTPSDFASICLLCGNKAARDYFSENLVGGGLRATADYINVEAVSREQEMNLPAWFNRVYLVSGASDTNLFMANRWLLPVERMMFDALRSQHKRFIYSLKSGARMEFVLYAEDDEGIKAVIRRFKELERVSEGLEVVL